MIDTVHPVSIGREVAVVCCLIMLLVAVIATIITGSREAMTAAVILIAFQFFSLFADEQQ